MSGPRSVRRSVVLVSYVTYQYYFLPAFLYLCAVNVTAHSRSSHTQYDTTKISIMISPTKNKTLGMSI
jgi:hypothetical protein